MSVHSTRIPSRDQGHKPIYRAQTGSDILNLPVVCRGEEFLNANGEDVRQIRISFLTPTRIKAEKHLWDRPLPFHILIWRLLERVMEMDREYCGKLWQFTDKDKEAWVLRAEEEIRLISQKTQWVDWGRYSPSQKSYMKLGGVIGDAVYEGPLTPYMPILRIGEYIHVGKQSTFGNGQIRVSIVQSSSSQKL